jgi:type IV secretion system protein TrbL
MTFRRFALALGLLVCAAPALAAVPSSGALTDMLNTIGSMFGAGQAALAPTARWILGTMIVIELVWFGLQIALSPGDAGSVARDGIRKVVFLGVFVWFISSFGWLTQQVVKGFIWVGGTAGGAAVTPTLNDPSGIIDMGFTATQPILDHLAAYGVMGFMANLPDVIISGLCALLVLFAFFILAIQVFVTYIEFGIVATLGLVLIPFGVNGKLAFLAEKVFGSIIAFGVKLMVLAFIIAIALPVLATYSLPPDPTWAQMFNMAVIVFGVLFLAWHAPSVAAGMMAGGPSLTAGTAAGTAVAGALGLGLMGFGAVRAAQGGVQATAAAAGAVGRGAIAATHGASAVVAGGQIGAAAAAVGGAGPVGQAVGAMQGAGRVMGAPISRAANAALSPVQAVATAFRDAWQRGGITGWRASGGTVPQSVSTAAPAANTVGRAATTQQAGVHQVMQTAHLARSVIPGEAAPSGGATPSIHS